MATKPKAGVAQTATTSDVKDQFRQLMRTSLISGDRAGNPVLIRVAEHFGQDPGELPTISQPLGFLINQQAALDAFLGEAGREHEVLGVVIPTSHPAGFALLSDVLLPPSLPIPAPRFGQVADRREEAGFGRWLSCWTRALVLFRDEDGPGAMWVTERGVEVMATSAARVAAIHAQLRGYAKTESPFRGQCVVMKMVKRRLKIHFAERPARMKPEDVILPPGLLEKIEGHVLDISRRADDLVRANRHLKRGLLLWGRPGTGKTHTIRYLASQLPDHTVITLPGKHLEALGFLARMIEYCVPGIVVLDDVDYIAEDRTMPSMGATSNLYELLETLDGMNPDADLLFVLTTNRADTLEPAIAARPGRVDQAMEVPPPDADCRRRLLELYSQGVVLELDGAEIDAVVERTNGVTGSFFKELMRRASLAAANDEKRQGDKLVVTNKYVVDAIEEMLDPSSPLTQKMLGLTDEHAPLGAE